MKKRTFYNCFYCFYLNVNFCLKYLNFNLQFLSINVLNETKQKKNKTTIVELRGRMSGISWIHLDSTPTTTY